MRFRPLCLPLSLLLAAGGLRAETPTIPDYSQTPRAEVPDSYKFNIADIFPDENAWRKEFDLVKELATTIDEVAKDWTRSAAAMADLLERVATVNRRGERLFAWARLQNDMDLSNPEFTRMQTEFQNLAVEFGSRTSFIAPDLLAIGDDTVLAHIRSEPRLQPFAFQIEKILRARNHTLSSAEQTIVTRFGLFADTPAKVSTLLNDVDMPNAEVTLSDGTKVLLNENNYLKYRISKNPADRKTVVEAYWKNVLKYENTFAALLDGEMEKQVALARIHRFPTCLEATLFDNNIEPAVYHNVVSTVRNNLAPLHRFFRLKQKMLGLEELHYYDTPVPAAPTVEKFYPYEECQQHLLAAFKPLGQDYVNGIQQAFSGRWIDLYPNLGKQGGAYSFGIYDVHPFIKMNFSGRYNDMSTLAHELGHAMHSMLSNANQPYPTARYAIFTAEIASTFNEILLLKEVIRNTTDDRVKLSLLESFLERMRGTIYAQSMLAEFELAMHTQAEKGQPLTAKWLRETFASAYKHYNGVDQGVVKYDDTLAVTWASVPHFYRPFYVFQYTTGMVAATALADAVLNGGETERDRYLNLLKSGGKKFPLDLLRDAGVDMSKPDPILAAIRQFDSLVAEMEAIHARLPKDPAAN